MQLKTIRSIRSQVLSFAFVVVQPVALASPPTQSDFSVWQSEQAEELSKFEQFLLTAKVQDVVPMHELTRTATDWRVCGGPAFQIPPKQQWGAISRTLELIRTLRAQTKSLAKMEVVSGYRNPRLNRCAGGASRSAHTRSFAVDLVGPADAAAGLCKFWKRRGAEYHMGLSRYASGRIHVDAAGYRTWGDDFTRKTTYCR